MDGLSGANQLASTPSKRRRVKKVDSEHAKKIKIGRMSDDEFRRTYPEHAQLVDFLSDVMTKARVYHEGKQLRRSRKESFPLLKKWTFAELKPCILWCFSSAKADDPFWGGVPVNHLGTVATIMKSWIQTRTNQSKQDNRQKLLDQYND